ncbi:4-alpha-glucanotransferase [Shewanella cyperi]|uniref:4-alpha-glucanotransferase n=1 Tax=Shewanella cyperi TaxID=2814292 RepID=UPI001A93EF9C|nr:4-alpha-glucanotransferase [Shewanella cyperi]QSX41766.1 4-alpha-glucanotransferase [Shewanella cyperi]
MALDKLLYLQGVGDRFIDCLGRDLPIDPGSRRALLNTMLGLPVGEVLADELINERIFELDAAPWRGLLPRFQWQHVDAAAIECFLPAGMDQTFECHIQAEGQQEWLSLELSPKAMRVTGEYRIDDIQYLRFNAVLNPGPGLGYHRLRLCHPLLGEAEGILMLAPRQAFLGRLEPGRRNQQRLPFGVSVGLWALRSANQWGIGDFGDLGQLLDFLCREGADFVLLNPLHAPDIASPEDPSPYSPWDRRWLNPLYIQIEDCAEYPALSQEFAGNDWQIQRKLLNQDAWLDYPRVQGLKYRAFALLFQQFCRLKDDNLRRSRLADFVAAQGQALVDFARAEVSRARVSPLWEGAADAPWLRDCLAREDFHQYLQFIAADQLQLCQLRARQGGMSIGLVRDLAVGARAGGSELTSANGLFCQEASIGAPPDPFSATGQDWGLLPPDPIAMAKQNFSHFIALLRANMSGCGALRIDHIMGLQRLWWWVGRDGGYVYYPSDTLLAILCLESQRNCCLVLGEDLGTVAPDLRHRLWESAIPGNDLFYFCREGEDFCAPAHYRHQSLMMQANHDVAPLSAWWSGSDLHLRRQLELIGSDEELGAALAAREQDKEALLRRLEQEGLLEAGAERPLAFDSLLPRTMALVAKGRSLLVSVQLADLARDRHPVNIPGTSHQYANWQRRLPASLTTLFADPLLLQCLHLIRQGRLQAAQDCAD